MVVTVAIAALHRHGSSLTVKVDGRTWTTTASEVTVRGVAHTIINLVADNGEVMPANIALTAGEDTWSQPWFPLREILQNALDEGGTCLCTAATLPDPIEGGTTMSIELTPDLALAWEGRDEWYHQRHPEIIYNMPSGIIDSDQIFDTDNEWERQFQFDAMKENVMELLPPSFYPSTRWIDREDAVWAENKLAMLVANQDDCSSVSIAIVPKDDGPPWALALRHVEQIGPCFLAKVAELYGPLRQRTSGYTTGPYQPIALT